MKNSDFGTPYDLGTLESIDGTFWKHWSAACRHIKKLLSKNVFNSHSHAVKCVNRQLFGVRAQNDGVWGLCVGILSGGTRSDKRKCGQTNLNLVLW